MERRTLALTISSILIILGSLIVPLTITPAIASPGANYETVTGVLTSDYFSLYPYSETSIDIGISKYGEMIDGEGLFPDTGLQYPGYESVMTHDQRLDTSRDAFANEYVEKQLWLNGWMVEARYTHRFLGDRRVLTMAMSADMAAYGGDWKVGHSDDFAAAPHGGRKTTGYAETEDLEVLYDGPRKYIAICKTTIYDWDDGDEDGLVDHPDETWPILDFRLTFIFNKVKKYVVILKDIKVLMSGKMLSSPFDIQMSNREEWDLGPYPAFGSYAYFYRNLETCYGTEEGSDVHLAPGIMREFIYKGLGAIPSVPISSPPDWVGPIVEGSVRVYVEGEWMHVGDDYDIDLASGLITWYTTVGEEDEVEVVYKLWKEYEENGIPHLYDVAQIISADEPDPLYVGFKAFWPSLSDYAIDGWLLALDPLINVSQADMGVEPEIPFVIGEWDFMLGKEYPLQFRGVEVCGITDYNDAGDDDMDESKNMLDREVEYQLDEVFYPWDLYSAVHKKYTARWVEFFDGDDETTTFSLNKTAYLSFDWDGPVDDTDSEKVLVDGVLQVPNRVVPPRTATSYTYTLSGNDIIFDEAPPEGAVIKVLYSTDGWYETGYETWWGPGRYEWAVVGRDAATVDSAGASLVTAALKQKWKDIGIAGEDMMDPMIGNMIPSVMAKLDTGDTMDAYKDVLGRAALKDDWCTYWPITSSNMLGVGGALANMLAYYGNDFTDAFYGIPDYTPSLTYEGLIAGQTCWNRGWDGTWNVYESSESTGYAVVTTYKDINGTVLLLVWGHWGRDTYYGTQWLHGDAARMIPPGIVQLQSAPHCLTSIILEIDYTDPEHPTFSIVEALGTITEFDWTHSYEYNSFRWVEEKGGIHDP
jgi:hypothetical protein